MNRSTIVPVLILGSIAWAVPAHSVKPDPKFDQAFADYLTKRDLKAFAIAVDDLGAWSFGYSEGMNSEKAARKEALRQCEKYRKQSAVAGACEILAVGSERVRVLKWPEPRIAPPSPNTSYETRWVQGTSFIIGRSEDLQVWVAFTVGSDPQALLYLVNGSDRTITFAPESIIAAVIKNRNGQQTRIPIETYSAAAYQKKVRTKQAWQAALHAAAVAFSSRPQPQTSTFSGSYEAYQPHQVQPTFYGSYYGTITTWPTAADYAAASERSAARVRAMSDQLAASYAALTESLLQTHTLDPGTYYGGIVHFAKAKGDLVDLLIPFGGETFRVSFTFPK